MGRPKFDFHTDRDGRREESEQRRERPVLRLPRAEVRRRRRDEDWVNTKEFRCLCHFLKPGQKLTGVRGALEDAVALEGELLHRAGIVDTGLFLGMAEAAVIASPEGVYTLTP